MEDLSYSILGRFLFLKLSNLDVCLVDFHGIPLLFDGKGSYMREPQPIHYRHDDNLLQFQYKVFHKQISYEHLFFQAQLNGSAGGGEAGKIHFILAPLLANHAGFRAVSRCPGAGVGPLLV